MRGTPIQHDPWTAVFQVLCRVEGLVAPAYPDLGGFYGYDQLPLTSFMAGLDACGPPQGRTFLDLGCGLGSKMLLAFMLGWKVDGVEMHAPYADVARKLVAQAVVHLCDAFEFDGFDRYDLIYTYALCHDLDRQADLHAVIAERAKPGALVFTPCRVFGHGEQVAEFVWRL